MVLLLGMWLDHRRCLIALMFCALSFCVYVASWVCCNNGLLPDLRHCFFCASFSDHCVYYFVIAYNDPSVDYCACVFVVVVVIVTLLLDSHYI